jgi:hypothetical protein
MRNAVTAALALAAALVAHTGCVPFGCGGFEGGGNLAYERGTEMLLLCENGGFVATLDTQMLEGRFQSQSGVVTGTKGDDGQLAFELVESLETSEWTSTQLGDGAWTMVNLDTVAADHANVLCNDLATRPWWTAPTTAQ